MTAAFASTLTCSGPLPAENSRNSPWTLDSEPPTRPGNSVSRENATCTAAMVRACGRTLDYLSADPSALTQQIRSDPPKLHGAGDAYFGLAWDALEWLERTVQPEMTTLETGSGASSIVFAARGSAHTVISPSPDEHERIQSWCDQHGISTSRVTFLAESSDAALIGPDAGAARPGARGRRSSVPLSGAGLVLTPRGT